MRTYKACCFLLALLIVVACKKEEKVNYIILSGKIENLTENNLYIGDRFYKPLVTLNIQKDGTFKDTLYLPKGYYTLNFGQEYTNLFLRPGAHISLSADLKNLDQSLSYTGKGAPENNYLSEKIRLSEGFNMMNYWYYYKDLEEKAFLTITDSINKAKQDLLKSQKNINKEFVIIETKANEFEKLTKYYYYSDRLKENGGTLSKSFPEPFNNVNVNNEKLLLHPEYLNYITNYLGEKSLKTKNQITDKHFAFIKTVDKAVTNKEIKQQLLYSIGRLHLDKIQELDSAYAILDKALINKNYKKEVTAKYESIKRTAKGKPTPGFQFLSSEGDSLSLNDLKGKLVYIDIWATWCVPCMRELPSLKKMKEHFKEEDLAIVSICTWDEQEKWKKMMSRKKMDGLQLFTEHENKFFDFFLVYGVPRFILLDKNGKIIDAHAKKPSQPELWEEIKQYL